MLLDKVSTKTGSERVVIQLIIPGILQHMSRVCLVVQQVGLAVESGPGQHLPSYPSQTPGILTAVPLLSKCLGPPFTSWGFPSPRALWVFSIKFPVMPLRTLDSAIFQTYLLSHSLSSPTCVHPWICYLSLTLSSSTPGYIHVGAVPNPDTSSKGGAERSHISSSSTPSIM